MTARILQAGFHLLRYLPPERAHDLTLAALARGIYQAASPANQATQSFSVLGMDFSNPIGLAAGFDKSATALTGLANLGLGFIEIGSVTYHPQRGNPRPRLFRLPADRALINRMGFNNDGAQVVRTRLAHWREHKPASFVRIGVNIGCNRDCEDPAQNYADCAGMLADLADYLVINVSSPNTPGLRELQRPDDLRRILWVVRERCRAAPLLIKIAPELDEADLTSIIRFITEEKLADGLIIANTTTVRPAHLHDHNAHQAGGLSGAPLAARASALLVWVRQHFGDELVLISSGGIMNATDARARLDAGADLIQLYSGFVYGGLELLIDLQNLDYKKQKNPRH
ncbi:MAG: quinone-dependent dihydroorotate dehydrogenase [Pseudomonadota bacterium]